MSNVARVNIVHRHQTMLSFYVQPNQISIFDIDGLYIEKDFRDNSKMKFWEIYSCDNYRPISILF